MRAEGVGIVAWGIDVAKEFQRDRCAEHASSLSFQTLLATVPLIACVTSVLTNIYPEWVEMLEVFVFAQFVPATGEALSMQIKALSDGARQTQLLGFLGLLVTTMLLFASVEQSFNEIWRVSVRRRWYLRLGIYLVAIVLLPLLLAIGLALVTYIASFNLVATATSTIGEQHVLLILSALVSVVTFALAYRLIPNVSVPWSSAVRGGLLAGVLFEMAKRGFAFYIARFTSYDVLYGALAVLPSFFVWIYLSWFICLLGAIIAKRSREDGAEDDGQAQVSG